MADEKKDLPSADQPSLEELKKEIQKRKKKARQSFVLVLAAAVAFLALGVAWFVSNNRVRITSGTISAGYSGVEIGSRGNQGVHDDFLKKVQKGISYLLPEQKVNDTSGGGSINWLLGEESNMKNYSDGKSFEETNAKQRKDYAIEPGTKGKLDFFVKPSQDGALSLELSLDITPYCLISADAEKETLEVEPQEVGKNTVEAALLGGHVLYFLGNSGTDLGENHLSASQPSDRENSAHCRKNHHLGVRGADGLWGHLPEVQSRQFKAGVRKGPGKPGPWDCRKSRKDFPT